MSQTADNKKHQLQSLHGFMKFVVEMIAVGEQSGEMVDPGITDQPIFEEFRQVLKDIPNVKSDKDIKRFALRSEKCDGAWATSMQSMDKALQDNLPIQQLVDQILHNPGELKSLLIADTAGKLDPEILAPILNIFSLLGSDAVDREKLTDWQKNSGNVFGLARHEGGKAEVSARARKYVRKRLAQEATNPIKKMIELEWAQALKIPGSDNGMKSHFVKRMKELVKTDGKGITVENRTITDWTSKWGGKLQKISRPKKSR